jgi:hypothetical protein
MVHLLMVGCSRHKVIGVAVAGLAANNLCCAHLYALPWWGRHFGLLGSEPRRVFGYQ